MFRKIDWKTFWYTNFFSILTLSAGIVFTAKPDIITTICKWIGIICFIAGGLLLLLNLFPKLRSSQNIIYGLVFLLIGILLEVIPIFLKVLIPILFGGWILASSVSGMYRNFVFRRDVPRWWIGFALCTASALLSIFVMTRPIAVMDDTVRIIGIGFILHAVIRLVSSLLGMNGYKAAAENVVETTIQE
ncbi:MAG: DUF308 domain-containing protein [Oscillospiraceae bacterium]|nr:DUF308 domain-containing protein [Oscillospiraceae bacterium]